MSRPYVAAQLGALRIALLAVGLGLLGHGLPARAQTQLQASAPMLDDIDVRSQGDTRIVRIRFNASVRFVQLSPASASSLYLLQFEVLQADDTVLRQSVDEIRRRPAGDGLPEISITYLADPSARIRQLRITLGRALAMQARQGLNARSIELLLQVAAGPAPAAPVATVPAAASPEVESAAAALWARAAEAQAAGRADDAVAALNELLKLPPTSLSMKAQERIGEAWEQAGEAARARAEYGLYLKLYPQGEGAARVAQRLTALGGELPAAAAQQGPTPTRSSAARSFTGSIAQYYYGGKAKSQSIVNIATGIDQATISRTTESSIATSVDLAARYAGESGETRAVLRGSGSTSLLAGTHSSSAIGAAYVEYRRSGEGLAVRAGRQSPISGGLLGLFDGISLATPVGAGLRLDVMGGVPTSALVSAPAERLLAVVLEADTFLERWGGSAYLLEQATQGIVNRRALGAELRYAGDAWSTNTLLDYDTLFRTINALSVHGTFQAASQTTLTLLVDQRRAPSLQLTNALISSGQASLKDLLQTLSQDQVREAALATSAIARQFLVSVARPLSPRWQASADLRYSDIGALPAVGDFEAQPATGGQVSLSAQLTGTNLYSKRDIHNFNLSVIHTPFFNGAQLAYNNLTGLSGAHEMTLEPSIRLYLQRDTQSVRLIRIGPGMRMSWRASSRGSLLGEVLYEYSRSDGPTNHDHSDSAFFYVGYRYELF